MKAFFRLVFQNISTRQTFVKNASWVGFSQILIQVFKFVIIPYSTRVLGADQFGLFYYLLSLVTAFYLVSDLGLPAYLVRSFNQQSHHDDQKRQLAIFWRARLFAVLGCFALSFFSFFIVDSGYALLLFLCVLVVLIDNIKKSIMYMLQSLKRDEVYSLSGIGSNLFLLLASFAVLSISRSLSLYIGVYVVYHVVELLWLAIAFRPYFPSGVSVRFSEIRSMILASFPFFLTWALGMVLQVTDTLLIKHVLGLHEVGIFQAALKVIAAMSVFTVMISRGIFPLLCEHANLKDRFISITRNAISVSAILAFPILCGGFMVARPLMIFLFRPEFSSGIPVFQVLLVTLFVSFIVGIFNMVLLALGKEVANTYISFFSVAINIGVSVALVFSYGITGVAIGTLVARIFDAVASYVLLHRQSLRRIFDWMSIFNCMLAAMGMLGLVWLSLHYGVHVLWAVLMGAASYFMILVLLREKQLSKLLFLVNKNVLSEQK